MRSAARERETERGKEAGENRKEGVGKRVRNGGGEKIS